MRLGLARISLDLLAEMLHLPEGVRVLGVFAEPEDPWSFIVKLTEGSGAPLGLPEIEESWRIPFGVLSVEIEDIETRTESSRRYHARWQQI